MKKSSTGKHRVLFLSAHPTGWRVTKLMSLPDAMTTARCPFDGTRDAVVVKEVWRQK